jgi:hypothetical protein
MMNTQKIYLIFAGLLLLSQMNSASVLAYGGDPTDVPREMVRTMDTDHPNDDFGMSIRQQQQLEEQRPITSNTFISVMAVIILGLFFYVWRTSQKRRIH